MLGRITNLMSGESFASGLKHFRMQRSLLERRESMMIEEAIGLLQFDSTLEEAMYTEEFYKELVDWLKELMELRKNNHRWIPAAERLPEDEGEYLCQSKHGNLSICGFTKDAYNFSSMILPSTKAKRKHCFTNIAQSAFTNLML